MTDAKPNEATGPDGSTWTKEQLSFAIDVRYAESDSVAVHFVAIHDARLRAEWEAKVAAFIAKAKRFPGLLDGPRFAALLERALLADQPEQKGSGT